MERITPFMVGAISTLIVVQVILYAKRKWGGKNGVRRDVKNQLTVVCFAHSFVSFPSQ